MGKPNTVKTIVWAVDIFEEKKTIQRSALSAIQAWVKADNAVIHPVYVFPTIYNELFEHSPQLRSKVEKDAKAAFKSIVGTAKVTGLRSLQCLTNKKSGLNSSISVLLEFARQTQAELIAVSTHGRSGPTRWLLGSFVENLTLQATIPLLIVNPQWKKTANFKKILFPTDFSAESLVAYEKVLDLAAREDSHVVIFSKLCRIAYPTSDFIYLAYDYYEAVEQDDLETTKKQAQALLERAQKRGVSAEVEIDRSKILSVADSILKRAHRENCLIAMAAQSGKLVTTLLGSTSRQVIRGAKHPVWIIHPPRPNENNIKISADELKEDLGNCV